MKEAFEKIIERLEDSYDITWKHDYFGGKKDAFCEAIEIVKQVASSSEIPNMSENLTSSDVPDNNVGENGWIPCSERLPEGDRKVYIVQCTNGIIDILGFTKDAFKLDKYAFAEYKGKKKSIFYEYNPEYGYIEYECEAWMPLPAPYQPKGEK